MIDAFSLSNKTILITGGSSGIGRQCAIDCSHAGAKVVLIARNEKRLKETFDFMKGEGHMIVSYDLTDFENMEKKVDCIVGQSGPLDGVLHCAGISTTLPLKLTGIDKIDSLFRTNVYSLIELTRCLCRMKCISKNGASIIFLSSIMGCVGESGKSLYGMTKGALIAGVRSLACEYAHKKIRFNAISPGAILTPINENLPHMKNLESREKLENKHLLGLGHVEDISYACIYLLSDAARWITGINLVVDGGYTAR